MAYFRQTDSLEDLKNQYRVLLSKFDYKNPKNAKLLEAIDKEYKQCERYAKRAPLRQAVARAEQNLRRAEYEKQQQYKNIRERSQRRYSKEEYYSLLKEASETIRDYAYVEARRHIKENNVYMCQLEIKNFRLHGNRKTYVNLRAQRQYNKTDLFKELIESTDNIEYAVVSLSNEGNKENNLRNLEEKLGKIYVDTYMETCEKYMDSVDYAKTVISANKEDRVNKVMKPIEKVENIFTRIIGSIFIGGIAGGIVFAFISVFASDVVEADSVKSVLYLLAIVMGIFVAIKAIRAFNKLLTNSMDKGISDKKVASSRITESEDYERMQKNDNNAKTAAGLLRLIARFFGV